MSASASDPLLKVCDLKVHFPLRRSNPLALAKSVHAVDGVSFAMARGRTFGIVGESGSGKTTTALTIMRLIAPTSGTIEFEGVDLATQTGAALQRARRRFQMVFQDPLSSLNPRLRAGAIVREPLDLMQIGEVATRGAWVDELFRRVGLRPEQRDLFPHQFSGGQRQRIGIARALASRPDLIVCDEPVSALDVAVRAQILNLFISLQKDFGFAYLFISHDLGVMRHMCDDIAVMYLGRIMESADRASLFSRPLHPYTRALLSAAPGRDRAGRVKLVGDPPNPIDLPPGCRFAGRCRFAEARCNAEEPQLRVIEAGHLVACHLVSDAGHAPQE
ncbi:ATP-binding cassette domain-containing protein [Acidiphilium sp. AL]|uniref:ABC transporter ATP-binding protein n=1 Tax=Acidiphilium sp. AL TaxID=2871704 RepID=UPI0021CB5F4D|nr:oligopeptide/dipeptide ABC transporter ATP-binding protein [Acidiphilium sp. AL]MCU4162144.1 ATP-binding cassette domain-containing protein [Acidiphilium sp. AL]